jgi:hypothetical protein
MKVMDIWGQTKCAKSRSKCVCIFQTHPVCSVDVPVKISKALNIRVCGICGLSALFALPGACKCPDGVEDECCMQRTKPQPKGQQAGPPHVKTDPETGAQSWFYTWKAGSR